MIRPGDVVVGDGDGIVVVPAEQAEEVLPDSTVAQSMRRSATQAGCWREHGSFEGQNARRQDEVGAARRLRLPSGRPGLSSRWSTVFRWIKGLSGKRPQDLLEEIAQMAQQRHEEPEERPRMPRESGRQEPVQPIEDRWTPAGPIPARAPADTVEELEIQAQATVADPVPLGLASFAGATFTASAVNAGWFGNPLIGLVAAAPILFFFGGISQFISAMWAFRKGNTFAATAFGSFGAFNTLFAVVILLIAAGTIPLGTVPGAYTVATTLAMFALIAGYLAFAATGISTVLVGVLGFLCATYGLLAAGFFIGPPNLAIVAGGYAGIVSSLLAFYASAAIVINSATRREVLPF